MNLHIFIDESGSFDEGLIPATKRQRPSVVGGVCSPLDADAWAKHHMCVVEAFNKSSQIQFTYPKHFHAGPLLGGHIQVPGPVRKEHLRAFYSAVREMILQTTTFAFVSVNNPKHFEYSPQATYVLNLVTALRVAFDHLAHLRQPVEKCLVTVAQRTIRETADRPSDDYMDALLEFVQTQLMVGDTAGVRLARNLTKASMLRMSSAIGSRNGGAIAADFICSAARNDTTPLAGVVVADPGADNIVDYRAFYQGEISRLLDAQQYAAAAAFTIRYLPEKGGKSDLKQVLTKLKTEQDSCVLRRELPALTGFADALIESRTQDSQALQSALVMLESLDTVAQRVLIGTSDPLIKRQWSDIQAYLLMLQATCHNHVGAVDPQVGIQTRICDFLTSPSDAGSKTYVEKKELLLQAKIRTVNHLFNNYQFDLVLNAVQPELAERERAIPPGTADELLGQMLGTVGQACAFIARTDAEMAFMARDYFEKSLTHFAPGTQYHSMSVNFLTTLAWQEQDIPLACREMARHFHLASAITPQTITTDLAKLMSNQVTPFDAVNLCRITASAALAGTVTDHKTAVDTLNFWSDRLVNSHPHEQICKWMGFIFLCCGDHVSAIKILERGCHICETLGFTVASIRLSLLGLAAITAGTKGDNVQFARYLSQFRSSVADLTRKPTPFAAYIARVGGTDCLVDKIKESNISSAWEIATFLPFNYA